MEPERASPPHTPRAAAHAPRRQGPELYQAAASATAAAGLLGFLAAAEAGQLALAGGASLTALFYASLATVVRATRTWLR